VLAQDIQYLAVGLVAGFDPVDPNVVDSAIALQFLKQPGETCQGMGPNGFLPLVPQTFQAVSARKGSLALGD